MAQKKNSGAYAGAIEGLRAKAEQNNSHRERAINTLSRLAFPGRARRKSN